MPTRASRMTTDHDEIRQWAETRGGHPATVKGTAKGDTGILRIDFPGYSGEDSLQEISWDHFFEKFDESNLAFVYQDKTATGKMSRFGKFVSRENITDSDSGRTKQRSRQTGRSSKSHGTRQSSRGKRAA